MLCALEEWAVQKPIRKYEHTNLTLATTSINFNVLALLYSPLETSRHKLGSRWAASWRELQPPGRTVIDGIFETYRIRKVEPRIQDGAGSRRDDGQSRWEVLIQFVPSPFFLFAPTQRHIFPQTCLRNGVMGKVRRYTSFQYTAFRGTQE